MLYLHDKIYFFFIFDFVYNNNTIINNIAKFTDFDPFIPIQLLHRVSALRIHLHEYIAA